MAHFSLQREVRLSGRQGTIESPGYPKYYIDNKEIIWTIIVPELMVLSVTFTDFQVGWETEYASTPHLQVFDGLDDASIEIGTFRGHSIPEPFSTRSNTLRIELSPSLSSRFSLSWQAVYENISLDIPVSPPPIDEERCNLTSGGYIHKGEEMIFTSPNYPNGYPNLLNCTWQVYTDESRHFYIETLDMDLEGPNGTCPYDRVSFYELQENIYKKNLTLCSRFKTSLELFTNAIRINFITDFSVNKTGFKFKYSLKCGGTFHEKNGVISTANLLPGETDCVWIIRARPGRTIKLEFDRFDFGNDESGFCSNSFLWFKNGASSESPSLGNGKYCGRNNPSIPESTSNHIHITFHSQVGSNIVSFEKIINLNYF